MGFLFAFDKLKLNWIGTKFKTKDEEKNTKIKKSTSKTCLSVYEFVDAMDSQRWLTFMLLSLNINVFVYLCYKGKYKYRIYLYFSAEICNKNDYHCGIILVSCFDAVRSIYMCVTNYI